MKGSSLHHGIIVLQIPLHNAVGMVFQDILGKGSKLPKDRETVAIWVNGETPFALQD